MGVGGNFAVYRDVFLVRMPFCVQCGTNVGASDRFCARCGASQTGPGSQPRGNDFLSGISDRNLRILCYVPIIGWIPCVIVLASERFRHDPKTRFHAFQGIYLFLAWLFVEWVVSPLLSFQGGYGTRGVVTFSLHLAIVVGWITMLTKTSQGVDYHLPIIGEIAERSAHEQR
jgi:uncharacterized membrane protein